MPGAASKPTSELEKPPDGEALEKADPFTERGREGLGVVRWLSSGFCEEGG